LALLLSPISFLLRLLSAPAGLFSYLFPFLPRLLSSIIPGTSPLARNPSSRNTTGRRALNAQDTNARFVREFEETYGTRALPFFENGYAKALDEAKRDLKYLLVVLLSPEHDDTHSYVTETLLSPAVTDFLKDPQNKIILWAGDVRDSEAYQVSTALSCTKFPFAAVICHTPSVSSTAMSVVARLAGPMTPTSFIAKVRAALAQNEEALNRVRSTRAVQESERSLRAEQNSAYEISLARDRERARLRREEEAAKALVAEQLRLKESAEAQRIENGETWKRYMAFKIPAEPPVTSKGSTRLSLRMPSGERVIRRFTPDTTVDDLYTFVECYSLLSEGLSEKEPSPPPIDYTHTFKFQLASPLPRKVFSIGSSSTLEKEIGRSGNILVEPLEDEDEEEAL
jgi:FAS-associated factor 2